MVYSMIIKKGLLMKYTIPKITRYIYNTCLIYVKRFFWNIQNFSIILKLKHLSWLSEQNYNKYKEFVPLSKDNIKRNDNTAKIISFYLPQFYENEVNNKYFGKGFMEWYKATSAIPQFTGHYQPHLPIDVGFYDLTHDDVMYRQIELAKKYGIYGFCFYYYWFSGDTLLEKPIQNFLNNKELNFPFCLMWTNETWTTIWGDGNERKIIKNQILNDGDEEKFANDIIKYIQDKRYIRINNRPVFLLYQPQFFEKERFKSFWNYVRQKVKEQTSEDLYIITTNAGKNLGETLKEFDFEGIVEFSHQLLPITQYTSNLKGKYVNPHFKGNIIDIKRALKEKAHLTPREYKTFKCLYPGWDNTARKAYALRGCYVFDMGPKEYKQWLLDLINWTKEKHQKNEQFVFVNAWNEWAEGAHLEPDQHYGYAYLQATKEALEETVIY